MKDREILLIVTSVILTLIFSNLSLFLKSFSSTPFASPEIKQAARQIEIEVSGNPNKIFGAKLKILTSIASPKNQKFLLSKPKQKQPPCPKSLLKNQP
jgi:hypothetical protein